MDISISDRMKYFMLNYDVVFNYVHGSMETQFITDPYEKVCRFCGRKYPEVKFRKKAHAISELLGNKEFVLRNECDTCNEKFGKLLEDELSKYMCLSRTVSQIHGKNGVPTYKSKDKKSRIEFDDKLGIIIKSREDSEGFVEISDHNILIHAVRDTYTPIAVYKAFVKMALSLLPYEYLSAFIETIAWIREPSHIISRFFDLNQYGVMLERFIPGVPFLPMKAVGFVRRNDSLLVPYYQFYLEFANFTYQIAVPCPVKDQYLSNITLVSVPSTEEIKELSEWAEKNQQESKIALESFESDFRKKYGKPTVFAKNMTNTNKVKNEPLDIALRFEGTDKHGECVEMSVEEFLQSEREKITKQKQDGDAESCASD